MKTQLILSVISRRVLMFLIFSEIFLSSLTLLGQGKAQTELPVSIFTRTCQWQYGGYIFTTELSLDYSDYLYYKALSKKQSYENYATEHRSHPYLAQIAKALDEDAKQLGYSRSTLVEYLTAFVQAIPYNSDPFNYGWDYPKYPIETLYENAGDCEDSAALLVALLKTFAFDAVLVELPGHMAAAVACDNCNTGYVNYKGKRYAYIETTGKGWGIGQVPQARQNTNVKLIDVTRTAWYSRSAEPVTAKPDWNQTRNVWDDLLAGRRSGSGNTNTTTTTVSINGTSYSLNGSVTITVNGSQVIINSQK